MSKSVLRSSAVLIGKHKVQRLIFQRRVHTLCDQPFLQKAVCVFQRYNREKLICAKQILIWMLSGWSMGRWVALLSDCDYGINYLWSQNCPANAKADYLPDYQHQYRKLLIAAPTEYNNSQMITEALMRRTEEEVKLTLLKLKTHTGSRGVTNSEVYSSAAGKLKCITRLYITLSRLSWSLKSTVVARCANCRRWNQFWPRVRWRVNSSCQEAIKARVQRLKHSPSLDD